MFINVIRFVQKRARPEICNMEAFEKELLAFQLRPKEVIKGYGLIPAEEFGPGTIAISLFIGEMRQGLRYDVPEERKLVEDHAKGRMSIIEAYKIGE